VQGHVEDNHVCSFSAALAPCITYASFIPSQHTAPQTHRCKQFAAIERLHTLTVQTIPGHLASAHFDDASDQTSAIVTSTSTPGSIEMLVICFTTSAGLCRSIRRLWILRSKRAEQFRNLQAHNHITAFVLRQPQHVLCREQKQCVWTHRISKRSHVLVPSPHGDFRVVMCSVCRQQQWRVGDMLARPAIVS
jgi:hypothetical protein